MLSRFIIVSSSFPLPEGSAFRPPRLRLDDRRRTNERQNRLGMLLLSQQKRLLGKFRQAIKATKLKSALQNNQGLVCIRKSNFFPVLPIREDKAMAFCLLAYLAYERPLRFEHLKK